MLIRPVAGGKVDKSVVTQVQRALKQLDIRHIAAYLGNSVLL